MGYHHTFLPDPETLSKIREILKDDSKFIELYWYKPDSILGSESSLSYLRQILEKHEQVPV
jgi:hypothetical protein